MELNNLHKIDQSTFDVPNALNLSKKGTEYLEFRFRGIAETIGKLISRLTDFSKGKAYWEEYDLNDGIKEIRIQAGDQTPQLVFEFPTLKVTGIILYYDRGEIYVALSESGYSVFNQANLCWTASFDPKSDANWIYEHDMMQHANGYYYDLRTNERVHYVYDYPADYKIIWDDQNYLVESEGTFYGKQISITNDFQVRNGVLEKYLGLGGVVVIPEGVIKIDYDVFKGNLEITDVRIPGSLEEIGDILFADCVNLQKVVIEEGCYRIGVSAFARCKSLKQLILPDSIREIGSHAFAGTQLDFNTIHLPENIENVWDAFDQCANFPDVLFNKDGTILLRYSPKTTDAEYTILDTVERIADGAFSKCGNLKTVKIPDSVKEIGKWAFSSCEMLQKAVLPSALQIIKRSTFGNCNQLKEIRIPDGVTEIEDDAFEYCYALQSIRLPDTLSKMGQRVFIDCKRLKELSLPSQISEISDKLCYGCRKIKKVSIPNGVKRIGSDAFGTNSALEEVELPDSIEWIGDEAFRNCRSLETIHLPEGVQFEGSHQFEGCKKLLEVTLPGSIEEIPNGIFSKCESLQHVVIKEGITKIGGKAFSGCGNLSQVYVYSTLQKKYGAKVFDKSDNVHVYGIPGSNAERCARDNDVPFDDIATYTAL